MTITRRTVIAIGAGALTAAIVVTYVAPARAAELPARTDNAGGVQVVVAPKKVAPGAPWEFEVTMNTHTKPLDADLTKAAALIDGSGKRYAPQAWQGDKPGGHHRKGVLRFPAPDGTPKAFEIHIGGLGGVASRVFKWTVK